MSWGKTVDKFKNKIELDCGPGLGWLSPESIRIKNSTKRLLHINDIINVLVNVMMV